MRLPKFFHSRKCPVKFDEEGRSARSQCFQMFEQNVPFREIAKKTGVKVDTVRRYHLQWKKYPSFERRYEDVKSLFNRTSPDRDKNLEMFANAWGFSKEQLELILLQPHGLRRLMRRKIQSPAHDKEDRKRHLALALALMISDFLTKHGGKYQDVYYALQFYMNQRMKYRSEEEADIKEYNEWIKRFHDILAEAMKRELEGRVKPDVFSKEERDVIMRYEIHSQYKQLQSTYWEKIAGLILEGATEEEAREKMYRELIDKGNEKAAKIFRRFQDKIHPIDKIGQPPPESPPQPPSNS